jgi:hypothetical protein
MIHKIDPGYFCVPSAIQAITGEDMLSVIMPACNRVSRAMGLQDEVIEVSITHTLKVFQDLGYRILRYKLGNLGDVGNWRNRFPKSTMLLFTDEHVVVAYNEFVYDNHTPMGKPAASHPFSKTMVRHAYLIRKM